MKSTINFLKVGLIVMATTIGHAQTPSWSWALGSGGTNKAYAGSLNSGGSSVATDGMGNSYVTGSFENSISFGTVTLNGISGTNVFVAKLDSVGNCLWAKRFGGNDPSTYSNEGYAISADNNGNCYVTGVCTGASNSTVSFGSTVLAFSGSKQSFILKYNFSGNEQWAMMGNGSNSNSYAQSICLDAASNCYITGYLGGGSTSFGTVTINGAGAYVLKCNASGNAQWGTKLGSNGGGFQAFGIGVNQNNECIVTGFLQGTEYFSTSPSSTLTSMGTRDLIVCKLQASGNVAWVKNYGGSNSMALGAAVGTDNTGNIYVTGKFDSQLVIGSTTLTSGGNTSGSFAFVSKFDGGGNPLWAKQSLSGGNNSHDTQGTGLKFNSAGDCFICGYYYPSSQLSQNPSFCGISLPNSGNQVSYIIRLDGSGNGIWGEFSSGQGSSAICNGISCDNNGNVYLTGILSGSAQFGSIAISGAASMNVFAARLKYAFAPTNTVIATALDEKNLLNSAALFPNPFTNFITIKTNVPLEGHELKLYDITGRLVQRLNVTSETVIEIDRNNVPKGIYFYALGNQHQLISSGKLVAD